MNNFSLLFVSAFLALSSISVQAIDIEPSPTVAECRAKGGSAIGIYCDYSSKSGRTHIIRLAPTLAEREKAVADGAARASDIEGLEHMHEITNPDYRW